MFKKAMFLLMFVIFMAVGCDQVINTKIELDTLESFNPESGMIFVPGRLAFEVPSEKEINKTRHFLEVTLNDYFMNVRNVKHVKENFDDIVLVDVDIPLTFKRVDDMPTPFYFTYNDKTLYINLSGVALTRLNDDLKKALNQGINRLVDIRVNAYVVNTTHYPVTLTTPSLFIDNTSVNDNTTIELDSGESTTITCSNVMVDLSSKQSVKIFSF